VKVWNSPIVASCEHGNEHFDSINGEIIFYDLSDYQLLNSDSASWSWFLYIPTGPCFVYVVFSFVGRDLAMGRTPTKEILPNVLNDSLL
jgi:hypothetical protein